MAAPRAPVAWVFGVGLFVASCAPRVVAPIGTGGPFTPDADEVRLWARAAGEERQLRERVAAYDDPALEAYLTELGERLRPPAVRAAGGPALRVTVLADPTLAAFALPDGRIFVHTGLLAGLANEAQLATVLARATAHVDLRHALRLIHGGGGERPRAVVATAARVGAAAAGAAMGEARAVLGPTARAILARGLGLVATFAVDGYGEELEREADAEALARLARTGYDVNETLRAFLRLEERARAGGRLETLLLGNVPRLRERAGALRHLLATSYAAAATAPGAIVDREAFARITRGALRDDAVLDARAGRFGLAEAELAEALARAPGDPVAHVALGDLLRLRSQGAADAGVRATLTARARAAYEQAAALDPARGDAHRQLGLLYYQEGEYARAREAFERYLALAPDAPDAGRVREYLLELGP